MQGLALTFPVAYEEVMAAAGADAPARREAGAGELGGKLDLRDTGLRKDARAIAPECGRPLCSVFSRLISPLIQMMPCSPVLIFPLIQIMPKSPNAPPPPRRRGCGGGRRCGCSACGRHSRAYIHHLLNTREMLAEVPRPPARLGPKWTKVRELTLRRARALALRPRPRGALACARGCAQRAPPRQVLIAAHNHHVVLRLMVQPPPAATGGGTRCVRLVRGGGTRCVRLVRGEGRGVSVWYGVTDEGRSPCRFLSPRPLRAQAAARRAIELDRLPDYIRAFDAARRAAP